MGFIVSFLFVFLVIGIATILEKASILGSEGSRKLIHIGVCNWWFIAIYYFEDPLMVAIVPACFVVINYVSYKKNVFTAMERGSGKEDLGTVYYAISLLILALWTFYIHKPIIGLLGILIMGYGDGFAAVVGKRWGNHPLPFNKNKSWEGSFTVFVFAFIITMLIVNVSFGVIDFMQGLLISMIIGIISAVIEAFTPYGFDNLTLPIGMSIVFYTLMTFIY